MIEIRFHGRGGQGAVIGAQFLADAAFREGKDVQAFPFFGVERRGAPVTAYTKIDEKPIRNKSGIYEPDYVIVMDPSLMKAVNVMEGLKPEGVAIINTSQKPEALGLHGKIAVVDATGIAISHGLGSKTSPIVNSAVLGAFSKVSGVVKIESVVESIKEKAPAKREENAQAAKDAYDAVKIWEG